jgi:hypothetical protein
VKAAILALAIFPFSAWAGPELIFTELREGFAPTWSAEEYARNRDDLVRLLTSLQENFQSGYKDSVNCARFKSVTARLAGLVAAGLASPSLKDFTADEAVHFRVQALAFTEAYSLFRSGREGGFGILFPREGESCSYESKPALQRRFSYAGQLLLNLVRDGLGGPGFLQMEIAQMRLLEEADRNSAARENRGWFLAAAAAVTSVILWRFAPGIAVAGTRSVLGTVPAGMTQPLFVFGVRTTALTAEGLAVAGTSHVLNPTPQVPDPDSAPRWEQKMRELEIVLNAESTAPELDFFYLGMIKATVAGVYLPYLTVHGDELKDQPGYRELMEGLYEAQEIAGKRPEDAAAGLARRLRGAGIEATCGSGYFGISDAACLRGLMAFARGTYRLPEGFMGALTSQVLIHAGPTRVHPSGGLPSVEFHFLDTPDGAASALRFLRH